jgi:hypothetical protein
LTEAAVLATTAGLLGWLAFGQSALLKHLLPADTPRLAEVAIDQRILAFTAVTRWKRPLFCLVPACGWYAAIARDRGSRCARSRTGAALVITEAAFATILLVSAGPARPTALQVDPGSGRVCDHGGAESSRTVTASLEKTMVMYEQVRIMLAAPGCDECGGYGR